MSAEENKATVRRFVDEVQSGGNIDAIDELCSPEFVNHSAPPGVPSNCEGVKLVTAMFRQAFPDSYFTVEEMVAEGDKVATRKTFHGTHQGEFMGIPQLANGCQLGSSISCA
jgi:predicted ester cyclase